MTFQEKLVILRKARGITQDEFASAVGVSRQAVYKWESGQSYPEVPKLLEMKLLFNISIDELLDDNYDIPLPEKKKRKRAKKEDAPKVEKAAKPAPAPKAEPAPKAAPAPAAKPAAPAPQPTPVARPTAPAPQPAPVARPAAPAPQPAPVARPAAPAPQPAPVARPAAPAPQPAPAPKAETKVDTVPNPIFLEDIVKEDENKAEAKKGGFFDRLFGRR